MFSFLSNRSWVVDVLGQLPDISMRYFAFLLLMNQLFRRPDVRKATENVYILPFLMILFAAASTILQPPMRPMLRVWWTLPRQYTLWEVIHNRIWRDTSDGTLDSRWKGTYRMTYSQFTILLSILSPYIRKQSTNMREPIAPDLVLAIVLSRLGFGLSVRKVLDLLGVGPATMTNYTKLVTKLLATTLYKKFIRIPT